MSDKNKVKCRCGSYYFIKTIHGTECYECGRELKTKDAK
jgi:hypothetical protein